MYESKPPQEIISEILGGNLEQSSELLSVLYNNNLDLAKAESFWAGYLNDAWADKISQKIVEGFVPFRIQTEFDMTGHSTHIYMVKMKVNE